MQVNKEKSGNKLPHMNRPCGGDVVCPFRKDCLAGWLSQRAKEFAEADLFVCHKNHNLQCAGHMLVKGEKNKFVAIANWMGIEINLSGKELVFDSVEDFIKHHKSHSNE